ncbi:MAG: cofactor assembly of complex C subunit B [Pseudanabaenaceae cyanobacterium SKYGB_i_bin29]|nr:cofactor assembly of complex C subunit B [Pseudanabaenaceae cyanobacterium SKYG29]MDW8421246.1 cofactor assembly of complex C subunit B [Pseudanabaenaceae cyanobacterium SKYGB_i_bin29]
MSELSYYSTLVLTFLLLVGLVFFVAGSVKERRAELALSDPQLVPPLRDYLLQLGYRIKAIDPDRDMVILEGKIKGSVGLALFLTVLAAIGLLCLSLVLSFLLPEGGNSLYLLVGGAPLAGWFYWRGAQKLEQVQIITRNDHVLVQGHRDTLSQLEAYLNGQR